MQHRLYKQNANRLIEKYFSKVMRLVNIRTWVVFNLRGVYVICRYCIFLLVLLL